MVLNGSRRLSDDQLLARGRLLGVILTKLDERNCAEQLRGGRGSVEPALRSLDEKTLGAWLDTAFAAAVAEHQDSVQAAPNPSDDEVAEAMGSVYGTLSKEEAERYERIATESAVFFEKANDADVCWFFKMTVRALDHVEDPKHQRTLARLLVAN